MAQEEYNLDRTEHHEHAQWAQSRLNPLSFTTIFVENSSLSGSKSFICEYSLASALVGPVIGPVTRKEPTLQAVKIVTKILHYYILLEFPNRKN